MRYMYIIFSYNKKQYCYIYLNKNDNTISGVFK